MIWATQVICGNRHSMMLTVWDEASGGTEAQAVKILQSVIAAECAPGSIVPPCVRCGSADCVFESAPTSFVEFEVAKAKIDELRDANTTYCMDYIAELRRQGLSPKAH